MRARARGCRLEADVTSCRSPRRAMRGERRRGVGTEAAMDRDRQALNTRTMGVAMVGSTEILAAIRELSNSKQLGRGELHGLLEDGIKAALAKKHGPNVQAEVTIDDDRGAIDIRVLKTVVDHVEDASREVQLEEARYEDPEFQVGDTMEIPVDFAEFGRTAVQAAKQRIIQRVRGGRAHQDPRRVQWPGGRAAVGRGPADRARQAGRDAQQVPRSRGDHPLSGPESPRAFPPGRADSRGAQAGRRDAQGAAARS